MHLGHADRQISRQTAPQSAQGVVPQPRRGRNRRRLCRDFRVEAPPAGILDAIGERHVASLSLPCVVPRHALASDRHRPLQIRRIQAQRIHPAGEEHRLLEARTALSQRDRMDDYPKPVDAGARIYRRQVRHDLPLRSHGPDGARHRSPGTQAICEVTPTPVAINMLVNRDAPPFNDPEIRRAMQLTIDRKAFLDIMAEGQGDIGGAMQPGPAGLWGLPPEIMMTLPGYGPDVVANREEARKLMEKQG